MTGSGADGGSTAAAAGAGAAAGPPADNGQTRRVPVRDQQWLLAMLPAFPLVLLVLRLWYFSRQDLPTMLLLVQYVNPLGLISALLITLMWALPAVILVGRLLGALLWASAASGTEALRSGLTRASLRVPNWVVAMAVALAALTWQLRFLPTLLMLSLATLALVVRGRRHASARWSTLVGVVLPVVAAVAVYTWLWPAITQALGEGERVTAVLLAAPPGLTPLLTGPVPAAAARLVTHWVAVVAALLTPFVIGAAFLNAPILPTVAMEIDPEPSGTAPAEILRGHVLTVDDRMTTILTPRGSVRFVPNDRLRSKTLCPDNRVPFSVVTVRGWQVEQPALRWLAGDLVHAPTDPRCHGRPLAP